jgi:type I protein arginine methyltransferase
MAYSLVEYQRMFQDEPRHAAYVEALTRSIKPGDVVIEIGTGFGVYAILAAKLGASKVYAIEMNELVRLGPSLAEANGVADKIQFFEMLSTDFHPPERADVVFADMRGSTPLYAMNVESMHDAATRFLKPGGVLIPSHDVMEAALISLPASCHDAYVAWGENPMGFDLRPARNVDLASLRSDRVLPEDLLTAGEVVHTARFGVDLEGSFETKWTATVGRNDAAVGLALWFTGNLIDGVTVGPAPDRPPTVYKGATLLFPEPLDVEANDLVDCRLRARKRGYDLEWTWQVTRRASGSRLQEHRLNSSMLSAVLTPGVLQLLRSDRTVPVTDQMIVDKAVLDQLLLGATVGDAAQQLWENHPLLVGSLEGARAKVVAAANRYQALGRV